MCKLLIRSMSKLRGQNLFILFKVAHTTFFLVLFPCVCALCICACKSYCSLPLGFLIFGLCFWVYEKATTTHGLGFLNL